MNYYKITFKQLPSIVFAHKYETADYDMHFPKSPENRAEISYIDKGTLYFSNGKIMREGTLNAAVYDQDVHGVSRGAHHRHYTVGITCEKCETISPEKLFYDINTQYSANNLFFAARDCAFLPKTSLKAKELILDIIQMQLAKRHKTAVYSKLLELFSLISDDTLSSLLREVTSHTLIDYINKTKIDAACEILNSVGGTAADLSALLSVNDEKYLCRLFKKYKGLNIKEYKKLISSK